MTVFLSKARNGQPRQKSTFYSKKLLEPLLQPPPINAVAKNLRPASKTHFRPDNFARGSKLK
jgi:hypothetical protein